MRVTEWMQGMSEIKKDNKIEKEIGLDGNMKKKTKLSIKAEAF